MGHGVFSDRVFLVVRIIFVPVGNKILRDHLDNPDLIIDTPQNDRIVYRPYLSSTFLLSYNIQQDRTLYRQLILDLVIYHLVAESIHYDIDQLLLCVDVQIMKYIPQSQSMPPTTMISIKIYEICQRQL
jgi:hypothetical protein